MKNYLSIVKKPGKKTQKNIYRLGGKARLGHVAVERVEVVEIF